MTALLRATRRRCWRVTALQRVTHTFSASVGNEGDDTVSETELVFFGLFMLAVILSPFWLPAVYARLPIGRKRRVR